MTRPVRSTFLLPACVAAVLALGAHASGVPAVQTRFEQDGVVARVGYLGVPGSGRSVVLSVVFENAANAPVGLGVLDHRTANGSAQAELSDDDGGSCAAERFPSGLAEVSSRASSLTVLPARSRMTATFHFPGCSLHGSAFSFSADFIREAGGRRATLTVPFWGLSAR